jgi:hypothetical protein
MCLIYFLKNIEFVCSVIKAIRIIIYGCTATTEKQQRRVRVVSKTTNIPFTKLINTGFPLVPDAKSCGIET